MEFSSTKINLSSPNSKEKYLKKNSDFFFSVVLFGGRNQFDFGESRLDVVIPMSSSPLLPPFMVDNLSPPPPIQLEKGCVCAKN